MRKDNKNETTQSIVNPKKTAFLDKSPIYTKNVSKYHCYMTKTDTINIVKGLFGSSCFVGVRVES